MKYPPMLAKTGSHDVLAKEGYLFEPKLDGYRAICHINKRTVKLFSRNGNDILGGYPEFKELFEHVRARSCVLDGEIIALNKRGNPDFNLLQRRHRNGTSVVYVVFDILMKDGKSLCSKTLVERKQILVDTFIPHSLARLIVFTLDGQMLWKEMRKRKMEGVMAKELASLYYPGERTNAWLKVKYIDTIDCVVLGYTTERRSVSSLALGLYDQEGTLHYIGKVGTGFSQKTMKQLVGLLSIIHRTKKPMEEDISIRGIQWVKPKIVVEVSFNEFTPMKRLRAGRLKRIRSDRKPRSCTFIQ